MNRLLFPTLLLLLSACSGDASDASDTGPATDSDTGYGTLDTGTDTVSFAADIQPITAAKCAPCHTDSANGGFASADTHSGWTSSSSSGLSYCEPGDPLQSYALLKILGDQASAGGGGSQMPTNGALPPRDVDLIEAWILDGCQP